MDGFAERRMRVNGLFQFFVRSLKVDRKAELGDELSSFRSDDVSADKTIKGQVCDKYRFSTQRPSGKISRSDRKTLLFSYPRLISSRLTSRLFKTAAGKLVLAQQRSSGLFVSLTYRDLGPEPYLDRRVPIRGDPICYHLWT